jgi:hypothetical protein
METTGRDHGPHPFFSALKHFSQAKINIINLKIAIKTKPYTQDQPSQEVTLRKKEIGLG